MTVTFETDHVSRLSTQVVDAPSESAEQATASTVDGIAPEVNSDHGATKKVVIACTHGEAVNAMPETEVVAAGCKENEASDENVRDCEQFVTVAEDAKPVRTVLHMGVTVGV
jgi:hypothetical protein